MYFLWFSRVLTWLSSEKKTSAPNKQSNSDVKRIQTPTKPLVCVCSHLDSCFSASAQSSRRPMRTADTSIYGSHTVNPRPIRSIAVRRMVLWGGSLGLGGCRRRNVNALPERERESVINIHSADVLIRSVIRSVCRCLC